MEEMVACAPLSDQTYDNDRILVHQYLVDFITGTPSEDYVRKTYTRGRCHNNGRTSFKALHQQYEGRGEMHYHSLTFAQRWKKCLTYLRKKTAQNPRMKTRNSV